MKKTIRSILLASVLMGSFGMTAYAENAPIEIKGTVNSVSTTPAPSTPAPVVTTTSGTTFYGNPTSTISSGTIVPSGASYLYTSGTVPPVLNKDGSTLYERYGDTKTQAVGVLKSIEKQLADQGLTMKDVVYLRAYLVADAAKENKFDFAGWNEAYGEFFNNEKNAVKPARSTVGVAGLVSSDWLIEVEAVAVYPKK
ncbi:RidA family protein [Paenibacillus sp. Marseille-Q4541]|uniref:RidA family protein n=1 Tax=Paenibacillus sp. Marseille-Q4541 TaxID=2831522 RepID=UPI001BA869A1|nr:RidA family protein [Paenibacillus sp. Marseille-Q4541]